ncbi:RNA polymerase sigma factor [Cohnella lubricantis]|uniref:RNA polymerase sigma factor n=2 Tax=Cohnella lubricantis TaxID=2163172 RepID=A0A841T9Z5_9BACL|nr:RNA polymerase sigma factor [Cohnella lubricantis]MBB6678124.1 RNA polymerase sigma factor [Cohnella lubricantis]
MTYFLQDSGPSDRASLGNDTLDELYRQMLRVARHKLYCKNDASDIVQEAWIRILEKRDTLRESDKLIPWAKTITFNLASNANRARRKASSFASEEDYDSVSKTASDPELLTELSDLLGRLDPTTRTLLLYKFYYGFRDEEIAAFLDLPVGTIKSRIHRGKERLRAQDKEDSTRI